MELQAGLSPSPLPAQMRLSPSPGKPGGGLSTLFPGWVAPETSTSQPRAGCQLCLSPAGRAHARTVAGRAVPGSQCRVLCPPRATLPAHWSHQHPRGGGQPDLGEGDPCPWGAGEQVNPWAFSHSPKQVAAGRRALVREHTPREQVPRWHGRQPRQLCWLPPAGARRHKQQQKYLACGGFLPRRQSYAC